MARIFISYARKHEAFARNLAASLSNVGASVWLDVEDIPAGMNWSSAIQEGLDFCEVMLVIIAPESMASKNVENEWQYYLDEGKVVIPVLLEQAKLHFQIRRLQYIDFLAQDYDTAFTQLHSELRRKGVDLRPILADDRNVILPVKPPLPEREGSMVEEAVPVISPDLNAPQTSPPARRRVTRAIPVLAIVAVLLVIGIVVLPTLFNNPAVTDNPTPDLNATLAARQTANAEATSAAASPTPIHTPRPTEDTDATINAMIIATDQYFVGLTATAAHLTPLLTATPTSDPLQRAHNFNGGNRDWQPFATIFPDDLTGAEMMLVPVGEFMMGSDDGGDNEKPAHSQTFDTPFWIDRTEVTRAMYAQCVAAGKCTTTTESLYSTRDTQPINRVTWFQAHDYCEWRGAQLPTEREWEYAARGPDDWVYPWGNEFVDENVVYRPNSNDVAADVGSKDEGASWVGAVDISGNVWEWVSSIYQPYPYKADDGREDNDPNRPRGLRGGAFNVAVGNLRVANRDSNFDPTFESINVGFRCARSYNSEELEIALQQARAGVTHNADWQPFATVFPDDPTGAEMMLVPVGEFMMGSDREDNEKPVHKQVFDTPFWIDRTEVTRAMYAQCVAAGECTTTPENEYSTRDMQPINQVTGTQAWDYCEWRGARLPTEREWEYAARGPDNWIYPWGNEYVAENVVLSFDSNNQPADAGSKPEGASWVGALDMSGNVWEWVSSVYLDYPYDSSHESSEDDNRPSVLRGGSYSNDDLNDLRTAYRFGNLSATAGNNWGYRCARSYSSEELEIALQQARAGVTHNADWQPFATVFPDDPTGAEMMLVPVGEFMMGSTEEQIDLGLELCNQAINEGTCERTWIEDEAPISTQTFSALFWIDRTEVTRAQYQQCVDAGVCDSTTGSEYSTEDDQPVNNVTWFQAVNFCEEWRGMRLPTEAEWEYVARGPDGWVFPWGDTFDGTQANHCDSNCGAADWASGYQYVNEEYNDGYAIAASVGSYPSGASWVGALDLSGNLWEWVSSLYLDYPYDSSRESPHNIDDNRTRVQRGGSFDYNVSFLLAANRVRVVPTYEDDDIGFRCARS